MKKTQLPSTLAHIFLLTILGCSPMRTPLPDSLPVNQTAESSTKALPNANLAEFGMTDFPNARSVSIATGDQGKTYILYGRDESLFLAHSSGGGHSFNEPVRATGVARVHVLPVEHPAVAIDEEGRVHIAWLEVPPDYEGAGIWYSVSEDAGQTFSTRQRVATETEGEIAMVSVASDDSGNPILAWLKGSELRFTRSYDRGSSFTRAVSIGNGSCECCQPQVMIAKDLVQIAYRSLEPGIVDGDIRDIVMVRSEDGGENFLPVARVSDTHWYLPACPIAGPSLAVRDGVSYIVWMDGRAEPPGAFSRGDLWFSASIDGGKSFSPNIRINADQNAHHTLPTIGIGPGGRIHIAWEAHLPNPDVVVIYYALSDDGGQTFSLPRVIADDSDAPRGVPGKPVLVVDSTGNVFLAWLDRMGARIASWIDTN